MTYSVSTKIKFKTSKDINLSDLENDLENVFKKYKDTDTVTVYAKSKRKDPKWYISELEDFCQMNDLDIEQLESIRFSVANYTEIGGRTASIGLKFANEDKEHLFSHCYIKDNKIVEKFFSLENAWNEKQIDEDEMTALDILNWLSIDIRWLIEDKNIKIIWGDKIYGNERIMTYREFLDAVNDDGGFDIGEDCST